MTGLTLPACSKSRSTPRSLPFGCASIMAIFWLTNHEVTFAAIARSSGAIQRPFGPPTARHVRTHRLRDLHREPSRPDTRRRIDTYTVSMYDPSVIRSFDDATTRDVFYGEDSRAARRIRVNEKFRITFRFESGHAWEVRCEDYH